jgi:thioredoxin 1
MPWIAYPVLGVIALMLGRMLWISLTSQRIRGQSVAPLAELLPELQAIPDRAAVYCYSAHCPPCARLTPTIDRLRERFSNLYKLDVQRAPKLARELGIRATPTTLLIEDGRVLKVILGPAAAASVETFLGGKKETPFAQ